MSNLSRSSLTSQSLVPTQIISLIFAIGAFLSYILFFYNIPEVTGYTENFPNRPAAIYWLLGHLLRAILLTWICFRLSRYVRAAKKAIRLNNDENHAVPRLAIKSLRTTALSLVVISVYGLCSLFVPNDQDAELYFGGGAPDDTHYNILAGPADISFHAVQDTLCDTCSLLHIKSSSPSEDLIIAPAFAVKDNFESIDLIVEEDYAIINFKVKPELAKEWEETILSLLDQRVAVVVNNQILIAPTIKDPLSSDFQLTGSFHTSDFKDFIKFR